MDNSYGRCGKPRIHRSERQVHACEVAGESRHDFRVSRRIVCLSTIPRRKMSCFACVGHWSCKYRRDTPSPLALSSAALAALGRRLEDVVARRHGRRWGQVGHKDRHANTRASIRHSAASVRLKMALLLLTCLASVQLFVLVANLPPRAFGATGLVLSSTTGNAPTGFPQGVAASTALAYSQKQIDDTPRPGLHISAPPAVVAWLLTRDQPCHDATMFLAHISAWSVPPGCYGRIYRPDPRKYQAEVAFGDCAWWVEVLHRPNMLSRGHYHQGTMSKPGAIAVLSPGVQGAGQTGHYAQVIAIAPDSIGLKVA